MADEWAHLDATDQALLVRRGEASPLELIDAAISRLNRVNPKLNAVIHCYLEEARQAASQPDLPDGPLRGVPFLMKDIGGEEAGRAVHGGLRVAGCRPSPPKCSAEFCGRRRCSQKPRATRHRVRAANAAAAPRVW